MNSDTFGRDYFRSAYHGDYDLHNPPRKAAFYLSQILAVKADGCLLDVGCAFGSFLAVASQRFEVAGVDVSRDAVEGARARLPGVSIRQAGVLELDGERRFDVVTCFDTLEPVSSLDEALNALLGVMAPRGVLAITVPVYEGLIGGVVRRLDHDPTHVWREGMYSGRGDSPTTDSGSCGSSDFCGTSCPGASTSFSVRVSCTASPQRLC